MRRERTAHRQIASRERPEDVESLGALVVVVALEARLVRLRWFVHRQAFKYAVRAALRSEPTADGFDTRGGHASSAPVEIADVRFRHNAVQCAHFVMATGWHDACKCACRSIAK